MSKNPGQKWLIDNFITGQPEEYPVIYPGEPTKEWIEGWNTCRAWGGGRENNPYQAHMPEYYEWEDGYNTASGNG